jgi:tRNA threonylcarbamoyladenosine biosynthesis protein TsaE
MSDKNTFISQSFEQTHAFAKALARYLQGGEILALHGDLGAGKTCFVQGLAEGLDVPTHIYVRSPTFTLIDLYHLDLYRLEEIDELEAIGWRDCLDGSSVIAIEWADRLEQYLPLPYIEISIAIKSDESRIISWRFIGSIPPWATDIHNL